MRALAIDTSTSTVRVAIAIGGGAVNSTESCADSANNQPSKNLLSMINRLLGEMSLSLDMVDVFAVSAGPGSFTGLRVGVGAALGFAAAMGKPVVGVETLTSIAMTQTAADADQCVICPILSARRGEVYSAFFKMRGGVMERISEDMALAPERLVEMITGPVRFVGGGFGANADIFTERLKTPYTSIGSPIRNTAEVVAELALAGRAVIAPVSLRYVRASQAELNWEILHAI